MVVSVSPNIHSKLVGFRVPGEYIKKRLKRKHYAMENAPFCRIYSFKMYHLLEIADFSIAMLVY